MHNVKELRNIYKMKIIYTMQKIELRNIYLKKLETFCIMCTMQIEIKNISHHIHNAKGGNRNDIICTMQTRKLRNIYMMNIYIMHNVKRK